MKITKDVLKSELGIHNHPRHYVLKKVKKFRGHEGEPCYQGALYSNGILTATWSDDSWGGPMQVTSENKFQFEKFSEYAKSVSEFDFEQESLVISDLIQEHVQVEKFRKLVKKHYMFKTEKDREKTGVWCTYPISIEQSDKGRAILAARTDIAFTVNDLLKAYEAL